MEKVVSRVSVKKLKDGFGHDRMGMMCDFYLDGKKMGEFHDDGWGGETDIIFVSKEAQRVFEKFLTDNDFAQKMFDNGWKFMEDVSKITLHTQTVDIVEKAVNQISKKKQAEKMIKFFATSIVFGVPDSDRFSYVKFKVPLANLVVFPQHKENIQKRLDEIRAGLKKGEKIFNTNLKELGLK